MRLERYSATDQPTKFLSDFCALPDQVRRQPYRHGLLSSPMCMRLLQSPLPQVKEFWLVYEGATPIARIAANVSATHGDTGFFGMLEARIDEDFDAACSLLFAAACDWLAAQGTSEIIGPVTYNTWFPYRLRLDDDRRQFDWEPVNPPAYVRAVEAAGFAILDRYTSTGFGRLEHVADELRPALGKATATGFSFVLVDSRELEDRIPDLYRISHSAFTDNALFEPIPQELFAEAYVGIANKGQPLILHMALDPDGTPIGFMYSFMDQWSDGTQEERVIVLKSLGVVPGARGHGIANALVYLAIAAGIERNIDYAISALVRVGIASEVFAEKGNLLWRHDYGLWRRSLG